MLTNRRQQQAICDLLNSKEPELNLYQLTDPYDYLWGIVEGARNTQEAYQLLYRAKTEEPDIAGVIETILSMEPGHTQNYQNLANIGPGLPDVKWLWPGWIPRGMLSMLAAWPGIGKTYAALDIARRLIDGLPAPDNSEFNLKCPNVIYVDAEDFLPMIHLRTSTWDMDMSKFYPIRRPPRDLIDMTKKSYQDELIDMCYDLNPDLIIVDSLSSVNSRGENSIEDLREILNFFIEIPAAFDASLILIHHLRKPGKNNNGPVTMHDLRGSGHLVAMARSIMGMDTIDADNPNAPRLLKIIKTNLGPYPDPLSIRFTPSKHPDVANLLYGKGDLAHLPPTLTGDCANWLLDILQEPKSYREILEAGQEEYSESTIQRARKLLNGRIVDTMGAKNPANKWAVMPEIEAI